MIILADKRTNIHTDFGVFFMDDEDAVGDAVGKFTLFGMKLFQSKDKIFCRIVSNHVTRMNILIIAGQFFLG